jgi:7-cyano-7-deazaguanine synthase in queuosine biosynthesis
VNLFSKKVPLIQFNHNVHVPDGESPPSQRARSVIFLAYGILIASCLDKYRQGEEVILYMCENGYISLNPPLTQIRIGSLSTRTTHPVFLNLFQQLLNETGLKIKIENPYQYKTKGQMLQECRNQAILSSYASTTTSCGRYRVHKHKNCGRCVPCLVRRAAFKRWGKEDQTEYKYNDLSIQSDDYSNYDDVRSVAMAILEINESGLDAWLGTSLNTALLGDTKDYKATIVEGLNELEDLLKGYNIL